MTQDIYRELASIRAHAQANTFFNALQTGLLSEMDASMQAIHSEMADARRLHEEGLAAQQEMLQREALQNYLEEFIYQTEKLVNECKTNTKLPPSSRYFMLISAAERLKQENISTPIIRGRDNKAAFDRVVTEIKSMASALKNDPEVQEAIAWAKAEQKKLADRQRAERNKRRDKLKAELAEVERELEAELAKLNKPDGPWQHTYVTWIKAKFSKQGFGPGTIAIVILMALTILGGINALISGEMKFLEWLLVTIVAWFLWSGVCYGVARFDHWAEADGQKEERQKKKGEYRDRIYRKQVELKELESST